MSGPGGLARVSGAALPIPPLNTAAVGSSSGSSVAAVSAAAAAGGSLSPRSEHAVMQAAARLAPAVQQRLTESVARRSADTKIELKRYARGKSLLHVVPLSCIVCAIICQLGNCAFADTGESSEQRAGSPMLEGTDEGAAHSHTTDTAEHTGDTMPIGVGVEESAGSSGETGVPAAAAAATTAAARSSSSSSGSAE